MQYRPLGNTGMQASAVGLGCAQLGSSEDGYAEEIVRRALELGVTFFDVARGYRDAEIKLGAGLHGQRQNAIISTKTNAKTREDAWREINESLERLRTDYVDNCHLHGLRDTADIDERLGPGGALEALLQAKEQGLTRHVGCTSHRSEVLIEALGRFDFEMILVPMNIVEQEPLAELIPLCQQQGVGVTTMKPLATGLLPAPLALKWLLNQPIASCVPGATTLAEVEENSRVGSADITMTATEGADVARWHGDLDSVRCRICYDCLPCPQGVNVSTILGTDVMFDHYRTMGREAFRSFAWSRSAIERDLPVRRQNIASIEACDGCRQCEARCSYGLPIVEMLERTLPTMRDMVDYYEQFLSVPAKP